jgi:hypothetical protein
MLFKTMKLDKISQRGRKHLEAKIWGSSIFSNLGYRKELIKETEICNAERKEVDMGVL